ncbi:MAG: hypothetical protein WC975_06600 [Phycisphaerae bacterium]
MKISNSKLKIFLTGLITLTLVSTVFFLVRKVFEVSWLIVAVPHSKVGFDIPSSYFPDAKDFKGTWKFDVTAGIREDAFSIANFDYFWNFAHRDFPLQIKPLNVCGYWKMNEEKNLSAGHQADKGRFAYFDEKLGLVVQCKPIFEPSVSEFPKWEKEILAYAGPEGIAQTPDKNLGRFHCPIFGALWYNQNQVVFYDNDLARIFAINFEQKTVKKSRDLTKEGKYKPIQVKYRYLEKGESSIVMSWNDPRRSQTSQPTSQPIKREINKILVLDETGRIDKFDLNTMEFAGQAGVLPSAPPFESRGHNGQARPEELFAYQAMQFPIDRKNDRWGLLVATCSREIEGLALAAFNDRGNVIKTDQTHIIPLNLPWGSTCVIGKYIMENLHPPILNLASYFTAKSFEAVEGHRAIFVLPNSYVAEFNRQDTDMYGFSKFLVALIIISPSIIFAMILAILVNRNAIALGLSKQSRRYWVYGTIAFGLVAYITWRITRPNIVMVTCQNCGKLRRPDFENCQRCGSGWHVPELIPPAWRVMDEGECGSAG